MSKLKLLAGVLVLIMAGITAWWFIAASAEKAAITSWLENRRAAGWQAEAESIEVLGFPNRLDLKLTKPALADPVSGWAWSAPWFEVANVIYDPAFFIAIWPEEQQIAAPGERATLRSDVMEASLRTEAGSSLALVRASVDIQKPGLKADSGWTASAERITAHFRAAPDAGPDNAYEFRLDALRLRLPDFIRSMVDPTGALPAEMDTTLLEGRAAFDRPLDRAAVEGPKPQLDNLSLKEATASWGDLHLTAKGRMKVDAEGYGEGEFDISATGWKAMLDAAVTAGALPASLGKTLKAGLGFIASISGDSKTLNVPLTFSSGYARIGPVPVGTAPRLR